MVFAGFTEVYQIEADFQREAETRKARPKRNIGFLP